MTFYILHNKDVKFLNTEIPALNLLKLICNKSMFFKGVLGTPFGSLESEKIIIRSLKSEKIGSLESDKLGP